MLNDLRRWDPCSHLDINRICLILSNSSPIPTSNSKNYYRIHYITSGYIMHILAKHNVTKKIKKLCPERVSL